MKAQEKLCLIGVHSGEPGSKQLFPGNWGFYLLDSVDALFSYRKT
jgi:hypothetical protein